jgi:hypothetical protein
VNEDENEITAEDIAEEAAGGLALILMTLHEGVMGPLSDTVDGYRRDCLDREYSEQAAEQMAVEYHGYLLAALGGGG